MDKATFENYVKNRYDDQLNYYDDKAKKNQKKYRQFQWTLIILSALTPILAALNGFSMSFGGAPFELNLQIPVVAISAAVAILTTGLKTFQYQELWISYRSTCERLRPEIHYYNFNVGSYNGETVDKESMFVSRVETILDTEHSQWPPSKKLEEEKNQNGQTGVDASSSPTGELKTEPETQTESNGEEETEIEPEPEINTVEDEDKRT